jgi:hypothetical protein
MSDPKFPVEQLWRDWFMTDAYRVEKRWFRVFRFLPHDPRCKISELALEQIHME